MPELYQTEDFIYNQIPIRVFNHSFDGEGIFTVIHWHRNVEFNLVTAGRIRRIVDGKAIDQTAGGMVIVNSGVLHGDHWVDLADHFEGITVQISKSFLEAWMGKDVQFRVSESKEACKELQDILMRFGEVKRERDQLNHQANQIHDHVQSDLLRYQTMELAFELMSVLRVSFVDTQMPPSERDVKEVNNIKEIVNYIDAHYAEELTLSQVAEEFHYTSSHLSRLFKDHLGTNFHDYLQNVRLMNCVEAMKQNPQIQLTDCALAYGFPNAKSFITTFKRLFGMTPSAWLRKQKAGDETSDI